MQGIQHITNYKPSNSTTADGDASLAEELNCFFARFEVKPEELVTIFPPALHKNNHTISLLEDAKICKDIQLNLIPPA